MNAKQDVEKLLREGRTIQFMPTGLSMYPLLIGGRDQAVVEPLDGRPPKRGEVLLYRRPQSILVLHRLVRIRPEGLYFTGDNQTEIEGPLQREQALGRLTAFIRKGRKHTTKNLLYRIYSGLWLFFLPLRPAAWGFLRFIRRIFHRNRQ